MQLGHGKDHRPDLPQIKLMAAAAEPSGLFLAGDVHPGNAADDPLYLPLYRRVRTLLGQTGLLYAGDCKMAALETRAEIAANGDFYLTRLPLTGEVAAQFASWVEVGPICEMESISITRTAARSVARPVAMRSARTRTSLGTR